MKQSLWGRQSGALVGGPNMIGIQSEALVGEVNLMGQTFRGLGKRSQHDGAYSQRLWLVKQT